MDFAVRLNIPHKLLKGEISAEHLRTEIRDFLLQSMVVDCTIWTKVSNGSKKRFGRREKQFHY